MKCKERVIIYSSVPRLFRTTYIAHLYDIAQKYSVILLSEKLDSESEKAIRNSSLFPNLEKIISVDQYTGKKRSLYESHRYFSFLMRKIVSQYKPRVVIADSMINPLEKYLFRYGRLVRAVNVIFQAGFQTPSIEQEILRQQLLWRDTAKNTKYSLMVRNLKIKMELFKQHFTEVLDYWILPLLVGTYPFFHKSLFRYSLGSEINDIDYIIVFSDKEAQLERKIGRPEKAIKILPHPLLRKTKEIFEKVYNISYPKQKSNYKVVTIMVDVNTYGHKRDNLSLISEKEYIKSRRSVIGLIPRILSKWKIYIKPHPAWSDNISLFNNYYKIANCKINIAKPMEPADKYISMSDIIIGFPPPSTTLFTTMLQDSNKIIFYIDLHHELLGDSFADYKEVKYIDNLTYFEAELKKIRDNSSLIKKRMQVKKVYQKSASDILNEIISNNKL